MMSQLLNKRAAVLATVLLTAVGLTQTSCADKSKRESQAASQSPITDAKSAGHTQNVAQNTAPTEAYATPTGDQVSRAPSSTTETTGTTSGTDVNREPSSTSGTTTGTGATTDTTATDTSSTTGTATGTGAAAGAGTAQHAKKKTTGKQKPAAESSDVTSGGASNRNMSQAGPPTVDYYGTSFGDHRGSDVAMDEVESDEMALEETQVPSGEVGTERSPASIEEQQAEQAREQSIETSQEAQLQAERARRESAEAQLEQMRAQSAQGPQSSVPAQPDVSAARRSAVATTQEPEMSSRLNMLGASTSTEVNRDNSPTRWGTEAFDTEPYSRMPYQTGSVQITGKDKSVAVLEGNYRFSDPSAMAKNEESRVALEKIQDVNFGKYDSHKISQFQSDMNARLNNIDRRIDALRAQAKENDTLPRSQVNAILDDLETLQQAAVKKVDFADVNGGAQWTAYRDGFRTQLTELERSLAQLSTALR